MLADQPVTYSQWHDFESCCRPGCTGKFNKADALREVKRRALLSTELIELLAPPLRTIRHQILHVAIDRGSMSDVLVE